MERRTLRLYAITDTAWLKPNQTMAQAVEQAILGGATLVQLREKRLRGAALEAEAVAVLEVCKKYRIPLIINDDVDLARRIGADGVHVGQSDMAAAEARRRLPREAIVGVTAKTVEQARAAEAAGADYIGSGAVFGTDTKKDAQPMSHALLDEICDSVSIPVVAIGGICADNVAELKGRHMAGVATVSGIFANGDIRQATRRLREMVDDTVEQI